MCTWGLGILVSARGHKSRPPECGTECGSPGGSVSTGATLGFPVLRLQVAHWLWGSGCRTPVTAGGLL